MSRSSITAIATIALLGQADAFAPCVCYSRHTTAHSRAVPVCKVVEPSPPAGFIWSESDQMKQDVDSAVAPKQNLDSAVAPKQNLDSAVARAKPKVTKSKVVSPQGIFAPLVLGAKRVLGDQELNKLRADVILKHGKVIAAFVDTSESNFGQLVLRRMFEYADKDGNGTLDRAEVRAALLDLGFDFLNDKQLSTIMDRADDDKNEVIDFEEFCQETPRTLRNGLVKLAKKNGHDLGFLV